MALVPFPGQPDRGPGRSAPSDPDRDSGYRTEGNRILRRDPGADGDRDDDEDDGQAKMSFLEHLDELRKRIVYSVISIGVGFLIAFAFIQRIFDFVMKPLQAGLPPGGKLVYTEPTEAFVLYITMALIAGFVLALPLVMLQVWLFIAPGLYQREKKLALPFVLMSSSCFIAGAAFSHFIVFPMTWKFFVGFTSDYLQFMPRIEPAFDLYIKMLLAVGLVFQMPVLVTFMAWMGLVTAGFMWKHTKYAILIIFIVAAVITPSGDMWNQSAIAIPMVGLYLISIVLAWIFGRKKKERDVASEELGD